MENSLQIKEPIWIQDPKSGQKVNVQPFIESLSEFDTYAPDSPLHTGGLEAVQRVIRAMTLMVHDHNVTGPVELANIYNDLWRLWDVFQSTGSVNQQQA